MHNKVNLRFPKKIAFCMGYTAMENWEEQLQSELLKSQVISSTQARRMCHSCTRCANEALLQAYCNQLFVDKDHKSVTV